MGARFDHLSGALAAFIARQPMFFVASAPLSADGHVNVSPKGLDSFRVLSPTRVAYLDLTGSGNETSAHLLENGRVTLMFCAFEEPPLILRIYGMGRTVSPADPDWAELSLHFEVLPGTRQIIDITIREVQTSCGHGVPLMAFQGQRERIPAWAEAKGPEAMAAYRQAKNRRSLDGLPTALD
ncbi:MAG: pyridoxamine 5'-phosphate oxidase family protein [Holophagaceae bacterium]|nr:pyridoxamine 5'-phosphate oxidase family protein [Holophagaceae bacterium]